MSKHKNHASSGALRILIAILAVILIFMLAFTFLFGRQEEPTPTQPPVTDPSAPATQPTQTPTEPTPAPTQPTPAPTQPPYTGWLEKDGSTYYLISDLPCTGLQEVDGVAYCFGSDGALQHSCWVDIGENRYYADENGSPYTGWLTLSDGLYYLKEDGVMARGQLQIDGEAWFFTAEGRQLYLVNPWNYLPDGYRTELTAIPEEFADDKQVSSLCYGALMQMLQDCRDAMAKIYGEGSHEPYVRSAFRSLADQRYLFENKVARVKASHPEYSQAEAEAAAAKVVAIPGTSEHQLGLAVDIVDSEYRELNAAQEDMPVQKWLMEHCWEYGFILRYPNGTTDVTGIIYEPWHYRYVGTVLAAELHSLGITLEEYIDAL